jgi:hypothetical protein
MPREVANAHAVSGGSGSSVGNLHHRCGREQTHRVVFVAALLRVVWVPAWGDTHHDCDWDGPFGMKIVEQGRVSTGWAILLLLQHRAAAVEAEQQIGRLGFVVLCWLVNPARKQRTPRRSRSIGLLRASCMAK